MKTFSTVEDYIEVIVTHYCGLVLIRLSVLQDMMLAYWIVCVRAR
jgi:hypothetical protein